jgi:hypothetical protein
LIIFYVNSITVRKKALTKKSRVLEDSNSEEITDEKSLSMENSEDEIGNPDDIGFAEEPVDEEAEAMDGIENDEPPAGIIIDEEDPSQQLKDFKKISHDISNYEEEYKNCIDEIDLRNWKQEFVDDCTGKDFIKITLDMQYETYKIISVTDQKVRNAMYKYCYLKAGKDLDYSYSCDLMEKDSLDFLWMAVDFVKILDINKIAYIEEYGVIPLNQFDKIVQEFKSFMNDFYQLLEEVEAHRNGLVLNIKEYIDQKTEEVLTLEKREGIHPNHITKEIHVKETIDDPEERKLGRNLPINKPIEDHSLLLDLNRDKANVMNLDKKKLLERQMYYFNKNELMKGKNQIKFRNDHFKPLEKYQRLNLIANLQNKNIFTKQHNKNVHVLKHLKTQARSYPRKKI